MDTNTNMNPVYEYFMSDDGKNKMLSAATLSKRLDMRKREVYYFLLTDDRIKRVQPIEYGYGGTNSRVFMVA